MSFPIFQYLRSAWTWLAGACLLGALAIPAVAGIRGSVHDFSTAGWAGGQICIACHVPHSANVNVEAPLWNHQISSATYTLYGSSSLIETPQQPGPGGISRLCLSCHDGTVAMDSFGGATGATFIPQQSNLTTDLRDDHPIGVAWRHQGGNLNCVNCHDIHNMAKPWGLPARFFAGKVECASCHDVHNNVTEVKLLRMPLAGSRLCLHCHGK
jgi:predicted CXXCH cytochrome family protein